jgi:hypothetical protein
VTWTVIGSIHVSFPFQTDGGLAVTSHNNTALNTSIFDNVSLADEGAPPPPSPSNANIVLYANDAPIDRVRGSWQKVSDSTAAGGVKLSTTNAGVSNTSAPLPAAADYAELHFDAAADVPYTIWLRLRALNNDKFNDSVWVQFSDARVNGAAAYAIGTTAGLLVNLATDGSAGSLNAWGWQNTAYWLSQATTVTFANSGAHTIRVQVREDGVQLDQIVLSPSQYLNAAPGSATNDGTIVPKP